MDYSIPIYSNRNQTFTHRIGNRNIYVALTFNHILDLYSMFLGEIVDGRTIPLVSGLTVVSGTDLLKQYNYLGLGQMWIWSRNPARYDSPTHTTLNSQFIMTWSHE